MGRDRTGESAGGLFLDQLFLFLDLFAGRFEDAPFGAVAPADLVLLELRGREARRLQGRSVSSFGRAPA